MSYELTNKEIIHVLGDISRGCAWRTKFIRITELRFQLSANNTFWVCMVLLQQFSYWNMLVLHVTNFSILRLGTIHKLKIDQKRNEEQKHTVNGLSSFRKPVARMRIWLGSPCSQFSVNLPLWITLMAIVRKTSFPQMAQQCVTWKRRHPKGMISSRGVAYNGLAPFHLGYRPKHGSTNHLKTLLHLPEIFHKEKSSVKFPSPHRRIRVVP